MVKFSRLGWFGTWANNHRSREHITVLGVPPPNKFEGATQSKDNYKLVLVGKADEIREQAEKYGPVTVIPLSEE